MKSLEDTLAALEEDVSWRFSSIFVAFLLVNDWTNELQMFCFESTGLKELLAWSFR